MERLVNKYSMAAKVRKLIFIFSFIFCSVNFISAQISLNGNLAKVNYSNPKKYEIGGIRVSGIKYLDESVIIHLSGLQIGDTVMVPGDKFTTAVEKLWDQGLFGDVKIIAEKIVNDRVFLEIKLQERPRLSKFAFKGIKKRDADDIRENLKLTQGMQVTENLILNIKRGVIDFYVDKGYLNATVDITQSQDTSLKNSVILYINIDRNERVKIQNLIIEGNESIPDHKLKKAMKNTKQKAWYHFFKASKYIEEDFKADKNSLIAKYNEEGFRDASIVYDSIFNKKDNRIDLKLKIEEGRKFYFRNINWVGNTKYTSKQLQDVLGIKSGDLYNQSLLEERVMGDGSVFSMYQDNGYLFSNINPVEVNVESDSIDLEVQIVEGKQARVNMVTVIGNDRTNDHVILREIRTRPGDLYKRSDIQRTIRELAQLNYFDPEKLNVNFEPDREKGIVDLEYVVAEKASDQVELSGGYGGGIFVGTFGLSFNNFSMKNIFNPRSYTPLPSGDGQRLSLHASASGLYYQNYSISFVEPWLGGKKPNSLSVSAYHSRSQFPTGDEDGDRSLFMTGAAAGLGQRLKWPDDFFTLYLEGGYKLYDVNNYGGYFPFDKGKSNNVHFKAILGRKSSGPNPIFPTRGSDIAMSLEITPPYSLLSDFNFDENKPEEKYKWIEYHKWKFNGTWYTTIFGGKDGSSRALVLRSKFEFGFLGYYNSEIGPSPFEGFSLGGDGLSTYNYYGSELIGLRGYQSGDFTSSNVNGNIYEKFSVELRYPLSLNPSATFWAVSFVEAGNAWTDFREYNPFDIKRSAGFGIRVFMPMIGLLGVDYGYGFDNILGSDEISGSQFHFVLGKEF